MILVEKLEELVYIYLQDRARPDAAVGTINSQDLVGHIAQHLAERGIDVGYKDGSRLALPGTTPEPSDPERHRLPLVLQENDDGHVGIYCDGGDCYWSWPVYQYATPQVNGASIINAVRHAISRHGRR
jgi:hypothetical protein